LDNKVFDGATMKLMYIKYLYERVRLLNICKAYRRIGMMGVCVAQDSLWVCHKSYCYRADSPIRLSINEISHLGTHQITEHDIPW